MTLPSVVFAVVQHRVRRLSRLWNWKVAVLSASSRATVFAIVNLRDGPEAGLRAFMVEFCLRATTAGVYGSIAQSVAAERPTRPASLTALGAVPAVAHTAEFLVHWFAGTPNVGQSVLASVLFTVLGTSFNHFAMRRNVLTVGTESQSFAADLRALPATASAFLLAVPRGMAVRLWKPAARQASALGGSTR